MKSGTYQSLWTIEQEVAIPDIVWETTCGTNGSQASLCIPLTCQDRKEKGSFLSTKTKGIFLQNVA